MQSSLEKQLSEMKHNNQALLLKNREMQSKISEQSNTIDSLKSQLETLNSSLRSRDASLAKESANRRDAEIEVEKLHVKIDETERALESSKPVESENSQLEALRVSHSSLYVVLYFNLYLANCSLRGLPRPLQEHGYPYLWTRVLQTVCRRTDCIPVSEVPQLWASIRCHRPVQCPFVTSAPTISSLHRFFGFRKCITSSDRVLPCLSACHSCPSSITAGGFSLPIQRTFHPPPEGPMY